MLMEDAANGMVPYRKSEDFSFSIEPASGEVEHVVAEGLRRDGYGRDLLGGVRDFFRQAVQTLLAFGEAPYEIVYYSEAESGLRLSLPGRHLVNSVDGRVGRRVCNHLKT
jgi:hypothetical protein